MTSILTWLMMFPKEVIDNPSNVNHLFLLHNRDLILTSIITRKSRGLLILALGN